MQVSLQRIWVTGGTGFLGSRVVKRLLTEGHHVQCLVRNRAAGEALAASLDKQDASRFELVLGSLNDREACRALVANGTRGLHIASSLTGSAAALFAANVIAMRTLLAAVHENRCDRFVLVSSIGVYGTQLLPAGAVLDESCGLDAAPHLRDPYTFSKIEQERVCWAARKDWNLPLVVVRPGVIYGPGRDVLSTRVGLRVGPLMLRMGGRQRLPYTYIDNCADAIVRAGLTEGIEGEAFNIVDDDLPTGIELINKHRSRVGPLRALPIPLWTLEPLARAYMAYVKYSRGQLPPVLTPYRVSALWNKVRYTNLKARTGLDWKCHTGLDEGLNMTLQPMKPR